jgi:hypothetical protein
MHPQPAPRSEAGRVTVTPASLRRHAREATSAARFILELIAVFVAINLGIDLHAMRRAEVDELREFVKFREIYQTKYEQFLWQLDTLSSNMGATSKVLADALVRMRAQVQQQVDHSERTATATVAIAKEATKQAAATNELVQQVADVPAPKPPVVQVQSAPSPPPAVVQVQPAAVQIHSAAPAVPAAKARRRRRWFHLWLW